MAPQLQVFQIPCREETASQPCPFEETSRCKRDLHNLKRRPGVALLFFVILCNFGPYLLGRLGIILSIYPGLLGFF